MDKSTEFEAQQAVSLRNSVQKIEMKQPIKSISVVREGEGACRRLLGFTCKLSRQIIFYLIRVMLNNSTDLFQNRRSGKCSRWQVLNMVTQGDVPFNNLPTLFPLRNLGFISASASCLTGTCSVLGSSSGFELDFR